MNVIQLKNLQTKNKKTVRNFKGKDVNDFSVNYF